MPSNINLPGTIAAKWDLDNDLENCSYKLWVDRNGSLNFDIIYVSSNTGDLKKASFSSKHFNLADGRPHDIAACFSSTKQVPHDKTAPDDATFKLILWMDGTSETSSVNKVAEIATVQINSTANSLLIGRDFVEPEGSPPIPVENILFFRGSIGQLRFWNIDVAWHL